MKNMPVKVDGKTYWISRAVGVAVYLFAKGSEGESYILMNKRGTHTPDFQGYWNCPCGYLDYDETTKEAALRELREETGIVIDESQLHLFSIEDSPEANRQNITFRFIGVEGSEIMSQELTSVNSEEGEVEEIKWIPVKELHNYKVAFNQMDVINEIVYNK